MEKELHLSLIIPCYNESARIERGLNEAIEYLKVQKFASEIILVDDGSSDDTASKAQKILSEYPHKQIIKHEFNQGKGAALKFGILQASGRLILFTDIDFSTPITESAKLLQALEKYDVAIGVRRHKLAKVIKHQPYLRELLGHVFTKLTNLLVTPGIVDVTCGFKAFRREPAKKIFSRSLLKAWAFDAEILFLARKFGYSIAQVPVTWSNDTGTKVHMFQDGFEAFVDLLKIRWWDITGKY